MIVGVECVVVDCPDPGLLARFYQGLLGGEVNRPDPRWGVDDDWSTLHTPGGLVLAFQRVADHRPPRWPDPAYPQQFHLDLAVTDLDDARRQAVELGAVPLDGGEGTYDTYADPAGHPFCLVKQPAGA